MQIQMTRRHAAFLAQEEAERRYEQWQKTGVGDYRAIRDAVWKARAEFMREFVKDRRAAAGG